MTPEWIVPICVAATALGGFFLWFIKTVIKAETKTLNQTNGGTHLADVPAKVMDIEKRLTELEQAKRQDRVEAVAVRQMVQDIRDNQRLIMQAALVEPMKRVWIANGNTDPDEAADRDPG